MASLPKRHCPYVARAREHRARPTSSAARGYNYAWQQERERYLAEHPLCVRCEAQGYLSAATDVDHVSPVRGQDDPMFWSTSNWQALCHACHSVKTRAEQSNGVCGWQRVIRGPDDIQGVTVGNG